MIYMFVFFIYFSVIFSLLQVCIVLWMVLVHLSHITRSGATECAEPKKLRTKLANLYEGLLMYNVHGSNSFNIVPEYQTSLQNNILPFRPPPRRRQRVHGLPKCSREDLRKRLLPNEGGTFIKSTCPWYVRLDFDSDRLPQIMTMAECSCRNCYSVSSPDFRGKCEKIESFVPVIRRICSGGVYRYYATVETVPVGCTCSQVSRRRKKRNKKRLLAYSTAR